MALRKVGLRKIGFVARFWSKVNKDGRLWRNPDTGEISSCWEWTCGKDRDGYGKTFWNGKHIRSHQVSYILTFGQFEIGSWVLHHCDNPSCCNPKHLFIGTNDDNVLDKMRKGRAHGMVGESHGRAKLKTEDVIEIRERYKLGETQDSIAKDKMVCQRTISLIVRRERWGHLA